MELVALVGQQTIRRKQIILDHLKNTYPQFVKKINNDETIDV